MAENDDYFKSLTISQQKPLAAFLVNKGPTLKIWNYESRKLEHSERLDNDANLLVIHTSGLYVAVSFPAQVKMYCIIHKGTSIPISDFKISRFKLKHLKHKSYI
jgi:hypothetical protein